ncbi:MAG: DEAD/DEAH box helicase family protein, partial [Sphaerochaetaceae bacterium]|nr:DEAD/DEAH box helicase family protein [Sphaerochaetaceae bacterium]
MDSTLKPRQFKVVADYSPAGDQQDAIELLSAGVESGFERQTLKGVTGSGKTFTMAKIIEKVQRPTLVLSHNKTLAAQL